MCQLLNITRGTDYFYLFTSAAVACIGTPNEKPHWQHPSTCCWVYACNKRVCHWREDNGEQNAADGSKQLTEQKQPYHFLYKYKIFAVGGQRLFEQPPFLMCPFVRALKKTNNTHSELIINNKNLPPLCWSSIWTKNWETWSTGWRLLPCKPSLAVLTQAWSPPQQHFISSSSPRQLPRKQ